MKGERNLSEPERMHHIENEKKEIKENVEQQDHKNHTPFFKN